MKALRVLLTLALLAALAVGAWLVGTRQQAGQTEAAQRPGDQPAYDYEANQVVVRQMDATGQLQYELHAQRVEQLPQNGAMNATDLTLYYDPQGPQTDAAHRWILTANQAQLPTGGEVVHLQGKVRVTGRSTGSSVLQTLDTDQLDYNTRSQDLSNHSLVEIRWGRNWVSGPNLRANIKQGYLALESEIHGQIHP